MRTSLLAFIGPRYAAATFTGPPLGSDFASTQRVVPAATALAENVYAAQVASVAQSSRHESSVSMRSVSLWRRIGAPAS